jgi:hypothetical protein
MKIPPTGYLTLALLCGGLVCFIVRAFTGIFLLLLVGIGSMVTAMLWEN